MSIITEAKEYIFSNVTIPALASNKLDRNIKNKVKNTEIWVNQCTHIGDLCDYIKNILENRRSVNQNVYQNLKDNDLTPIEDFAASFLSRYKEYADDKLINHLTEGDLYSGHEIAFMSKNYDTRTGINILKNKGEIKAVFSKVNLSGGKYDNSWIEVGKIIKHSMYGYNKVQKIDSDYNSSIINSESHPIYLFVKERGKHRYVGNFAFLSHFEEENKKYFKLIKRNLKNTVVDQETFLKIQEIEIYNSMKLSSNDRRERLKSSSKRPEIQFVKTKVYKRNPDVVAEVLIRANGICENCKLNSPFIRASDNTPYLEVHHIVMLSEGGEDTVENAIGICPNCHRKMHFGIK